MPKVYGNLKPTLDDQMITSQEKHYDPHSTQTHNNQTRPT